jgi:tetratricopeptide (TPR) repeat protein
LRGKMGESLKSVRSGPELYQATTSSLEALRKFSDARYALYRLNDRPAFVKLATEAIALDTNFAFAYANLAVELDNRGGRGDEAMRLITRAYELRNRLPDVERLSVEFNYFGPIGAKDPAVAQSKVDTLLMHYSTGYRASNNILVGALQAQAHGDYRLADSLYQASVRADSTSFYALGDWTLLEETRGNRARTDSLVKLYVRRFGDGGPRVAARMADSGNLVGADSVLQLVYKRAGRDPFNRGAATGNLALLAAARGHLHDAEEWERRRMDARSDREVPSAQIQFACDLAELRVQALGDTASALRLLDEALARTPLEGMKPLDRPYASLAGAFAVAGRPDRAAPYLAIARQQHSEFEPARGARVGVPHVESELAARHWDAALKLIPSLSRTLVGGMMPMDRLQALAFDGAGQRDSAVAYYEKSLRQIGIPSISVAIDHRRVGELYEAKGDTARAIAHYQSFIKLWKTADPELQGQVGDVRKRVARLERGRG